MHEAPMTSFRNDSKPGIDTVNGSSNPALMRQQVNLLKGFMNANFRSVEVLAGGEASPDTSGESSLWPTAVSISPWLMVTRRKWKYRNLQFGNLVQLHALVWPGHLATALL